MRLTLATLLCLFAGLSFAQETTPIRMRDPVPYARGSDVPDRIRHECTALGHEIAFMVKGLMRGKVQLVEGSLPTRGPGDVLQVEIVDVTSEGNAFLGHNQSITLRGTLYRNGGKAASFQARRSQQSDNLLTACANLDGLAPNFARDISRWLKDPKDGAELGRSWF
ncbi:MAG: hypothetical protein ACRECQ_12055 [Burkholderiaceae bacterium]